MASDIFRYLHLLFPPPPSDLVTVELDPLKEEFQTDKQAWNRGHQSIPCGGKLTLLMTVMHHPSGVWSNSLSHQTGTSVD